MITDFLKTGRTKFELKIALEVLREFKNNESREEYFYVPFDAWVRLEQLEEYLEHLVEGKALEPDTAAYLRARKKGPGCADGD